MKQKRHRDKRRNTINMKTRRTASSTAYKRIMPTTKDYQRSNNDIQTDNKKSNGNRAMSMGLGEEDKKKLKSKTMDQKEEKLSSPKVAVCEDNDNIKLTQIPYENK